MDLLRSLREIRLTVLAAAVALVLLVPLVAMQVTNEVRWDLADFVLAGGLLFGLGSGLLWMVAHTSRFAVRAITPALLTASLLLIWANAAVGL